MSPVPLLLHRRWPSWPTRPCLLALVGLAPLVGCLRPQVPGDAGSDSGATADLFADLGDLAGTLVDGDGSPLADALLTTSPRGYEAMTDADGSWVIEHLPPGDYTVWAKADGWQAAQSEVVTVQAGQVQTVSLSLTSPEDDGALVQVTVIGPDGLPLEGALVSTSTGQSTTTDVDGLAQLVGLDGGTVDLFVEADNTWGRSLRDQTLDAAGGLQWVAELSGRADPSSDYIGTQACGFCHEVQGAAHTASLHGQALVEQGNDDSLPDDLRQRFIDGAVVDLGGASATLAVAGDQLQVALEDAAGSLRTLQVDGWIGSPQHASVPWTELGEQAYPLPIAWKAEEERRSGYPDNQAALHPYELDRWFDGSGNFASDDAPPAQTSADATCLPCHSTGYQLTLRSDGGVDMQAVSGGGRWLEPTVSCEACHGPGQTHRDTTIDNKLWTITAPEKLDPDRQHDVCAQCHSRTEALGTGLPHPFLTEVGAFQSGMVLSDFVDSAAEHWPSGAAVLSRMQSDELQLSAHGEAGAYNQQCFDCHDPHDSTTDDDGQPIEASLRLPSEDNSLCLSCHQGLSFQGDDALVAAHGGHGFYDPTNITEAGRCTGCHMAGTATSFVFSDLSGGGDHPSHLFAFLPPQDSVDAFDDVGATQLDPGAFPIHGCADCHAWNDWFFGSFGASFPGPWGDPSLRETHELLQTRTEEMFP